MHEDAHLLGVPKMYLLDSNNLSGLHIAHSSSSMLNAERPVHWHSWYRRAASWRSHLPVASLDDDTKLTLAEPFPLLIMLHAPWNVTSRQCHELLVYGVLRKLQESCWSRHGVYMVPPSRRGQCRCQQLYVSQGEAKRQCIGPAGPEAICKGSMSIAIDSMS